MNLLSALTTIQCIPIIILLFSSICLNATIVFALRGSTTHHLSSIDLEQLGRELDPFRSNNPENKRNVFTGSVRKGVVSEANQANVILYSTHRRTKNDKTPESNISPVSAPNSPYPSLHSSSKPTTATGGSPSYSPTYHVPDTLPPSAQVTSSSKINEIKMRCYSSDEERDHLKLTLVQVKFLYDIETTPNFNFNHEIISLEKTISKAVASHFLSCNNNSNRIRHRRIAAFNENSLKQSPMLLAVDYLPRDMISSTESCVPAIERNKCLVMEGALSVFIGENDEFVSSAINNFLQRAFHDLELPEGAVRIETHEPTEGLMEVTSDFETEPDESANQKENPISKYLIAISASFVCVCVLVLVLMWVRRRSISISKNQKHIISRVWSTKSPVARKELEDAANCHEAKHYLKESSMFLQLYGARRDVAASSLGGSFIMPEESDQHSMASMSDMGGSSILGLPAEEPHILQELSVWKEDDENKDIPATTSADTEDTLPTPTDSSSQTDSVGELVPDGNSFQTNSDHTHSEQEIDDTAEYA